MNNQSYITVNLLENRYVTDGNVWSADETIFNSDTILCLVLNIKTRAILGSILHDDCKNDDLYMKIFYNNTTLPHRFLYTLLLSLQLLLKKYKNF